MEDILKVVNEVKSINKISLSKKYLLFPNLISIYMSVIEFLNEFFIYALNVSKVLIFSLGYDFIIILYPFPVFKAIKFSSLIPKEE